MFINGNMQHDITLIDNRTVVETKPLVKPLVKPSAYIAAFDFDWTLVKPKDNRKFPVSVDDWQWLYPSVPTVLQKLKSDGYTLVIFTNQSKAWKEQMIENVMTAADIDICAIAWNKEYHKGGVKQIKLFDTAVSDIDKENSFFVGDALGRPDDYADTDRKFAEAVGLRWMSPESIFVTENKKLCPTIDKPCVIVLVGCPGSGKTTLSVELEKQDIFIIHGDDCKNVKQMCDAAENYLLNHKSCVKIAFDATNGTREKRATYLEFARKHGIDTCICIIVNTDIETAYARNKLREKPVPRIAYSVYNKHFVMPTEAEGFTDIIYY